MINLQEIINKRKQREMEIQKDIASLEEMKHSNDAEQARQHILEQRQKDEDVIQRQVFEEISGLGKTYSAILGKENIGNPEYLLAVIIYLWKHPSNMPPLPTQSLLENLERFQKEYIKEGTE
jgi:hypothetical protein